MRAIWLTWEHQRRNISLANAVGADYVAIVVPGSRIRRYLIGAWRTATAIRRNRPTHIFYQNPSIILALLVALLGRMLSRGSKIIGDFHNAGVQPPMGGWVCRWAAKRSDLVIVSNENLASEVRSWGALVVSIPDPLPTLTENPRSNERDREHFLAVFVCSWADDEPVDEVLLAAGQLASTMPDVGIAITGTPPPNVARYSHKLPNNVQLTGYLSSNNFDALLLSADVILDLTTRQDCMVCGAYEAVAAGVPAILSDNPPTRAYFSAGAIFVDNTAQSIAAAISEVHASPERFRHEMLGLKRELEERQSDVLSALMALIR